MAAIYLAGDEPRGSCPRGLFVPLFVPNQPAQPLNLIYLPGQAEWLSNTGLRSSRVSEIDAAIQATVEALKPLYHAVNQAEREAALAGTPENNRRQQAAQAADMRFWADPARYADLKRLHESGAATDPLQARQLKVSYLAAAGGLVNRPAAGRWLVERYFQPGNRVDWASHIAGATGEPLNVARFVAALAA